MTTTAGSAPRRGRTDKYQAVLRGALRVFARDGYSRAGIDVIAREAGVSTRTIYNHFTDKAALFCTVITESATQVAQAQIQLIDRHFFKITDIERDLLDFGLAWATPMPEYVDHFALVRQVHAEVDHIPADALQAWREAGPLRVRRELARRFQQLADRGLLSVEDAERAAVHFVLLTSSEVANRSYHGAVPLPAAEISAISADGVRAFLYGYLPRATAHRRKH